MRLLYDVNIFPEEHRDSLKDILYNLADIERQLRDMNSKLLFAHRSQDSKVIDDHSFYVVEYFRLRIDAFNLYVKYLTEHNLMKYITEAEDG